MFHGTALVHSLKCLMGLQQQAITHYEKDPLRHVNRKGIVVLPLHNQGPRIHSNEEEVKEKEDINGNQDFSQLDEDPIIATEDYECPWREKLPFLNHNKYSALTSMDDFSIPMDDKVSNKIKEGQVMGVIGDQQDALVSCTLIRDHQQFDASEILNPSMDKLSITNDTYHRTSQVYATVVSKCHTSIPYFEMNDHLDDCQIISSVSKEYASYHLTTEESTKMKHITLGSKTFSQHAEPREDIFSKSYHTFPYIKSRYCS